eukprot:347715-Chlamydomonas_euryale.AAC.3
MGHMYATRCSIGKASLATVAWVSTCHGSSPALALRCVPVRGILLLLREARLVRRGGPWRRLCLDAPAGPAVEDAPRVGAGGLAERGAQQRAGVAKVDVLRFVALVRVAREHVDGGGRRLDER